MIASLNVTKKDCVHQRQAERRGRAITVSHYCKKKWKKIFLMHPHLHNLKESKSEVSMKHSQKSSDLMTHCEWGHLIKMTFPQWNK